MIIPYKWTNQIHVPNHQPEYVWFDAKKTQSLTLILPLNGIKHLKTMDLMSSHHHSTHMKLIPHHDVIVPFRIQLV